MASIKTAAAANALIPAQAGIGLRSRHYRDIIEQRPGIGWLEAHSENYFGKGGAHLRHLHKMRADYPISLHGVGMSLGSADAPAGEYLHRLKGLVSRIEPCLVSDHLSWSSFGGRFLNDLAPLPYTDAALARLATRIDEAQDFLGRRILIENPSSYLCYRFSDYSEHAFLNALSERTGCGILLDVNNVYVSCRNHGWDAFGYIRGLSPDRVEELHLAGHAVNRIGDREVLIDTHDRPVCAEVWSLYRFTLETIGPRPTLIEWDGEMPPLTVLTREAAKAGDHLEQCRARAA